MNLNLKDINDECLGYAGWRRKQIIHALAKANTYQANKPMDDGDWWGYNPPTAANSCQAPRCNLPIAVARISANIPAGGGHNVARPIAEEAFVITDEMGTWNMGQMLFTKAVESSYKHLDVAAPMSSYLVSNYVGYIPIPAANTDQYVGQFIAHHNANGFADLGREHVSVAISVFMCGLQLFDPQHVHEHGHQVHGLPNGIASLSPLQTISLDKDTAFSCPDLKSIEEVGPEEKKLAVEAVYNLSLIHI